MDCLQEIEIAEKEGNVDMLKDSLKRAVAGFTPDESNADIIYLQKYNK